MSEHASPGTQSDAPPIPDEVDDVAPPAPLELVPEGSKIPKFCVHATGTSTPRARIEAKNAAVIRMVGLRCCAWCAVGARFQRNLRRTPSRDVGTSLRRTASIARGGTVI